MTDAITVTGMVISAMPVGDYDKRIVLLTKEKGKIPVFAKGSRRPKSTLIAATRPFSFGRYTVYEGRNAYHMVSADILNYFERMTNDVENAYYGFYFLEFADYYGVENVDGSQTVNLLYQSFRAILNENLDNRLIRRIFELKIMAINGEHPEMFRCICCGEEQGELLKHYSMQSAGLVCDRCLKKRRELREIDPSTAYTFRYVIRTGIEKLYTFAVSDKVLKEFGDIMDRHMKRYVDREFRTLELLKGI